MLLKIMWLFAHKKSANKIIKGIENVSKTADTLILSRLLLLGTAFLCILSYLLW